jgi:hypothetical protein
MVKLAVALNKTEKLKFLIDSVADISAVRDSSLKPGCDFKSNDAIQIKRLSDGVMKTKGTVNLPIHGKLSMISM